MAARPLVPSSPPALGRLVELAAADLPLARLGPLSEDELANTLAALLGAPPTAGLVAAVGAASHGQPLLVERLVRSWQASGHTNRGALVGRPDLDPPRPPRPAAGTGGAAGPGRSRPAGGALGGGTARPGPPADREVARHLAVGGAAAHVELVDAGLAEPEGLLPRPSPPRPVACSPPRSWPTARRVRPPPWPSWDGSPSVSAAHLWRAHRTDATGVATFLAAGDQLLVRNPERALAWFRRAVALDGDRVDGRLGLLRALVAAGDAEGTRREVDVARRAHPGRVDLQAHVRRAVAALFAGQGLWAEAALQLAEAPADEFWSTQRQLCELLAGGAPPAATPAPSGGAGVGGAAIATAAVVGAGDADPAGRLGRRVVEALATALVPPAPAGWPHGRGRQRGGA